MYTFLLGSFCFLQLFLPTGFDAASPNLVMDEEIRAVPGEAADPAGDFSEMLEMIRSTSPGLYKRICKMPRQTLMEAFMTAVGICVTVESEDGEPSAYPERKIDVFPGRLLERKRVFYLRMDGFTRETLSSSKEELLQSLTSSPSAAILDLRNADCGDSADEFAYAYRFFDLLIRDPKISEWYAVRPLAVLISGKTSGAAAFLASLLGPGEAKTVTMGSAASGSCFPLLSGTACGIRWRIPWIPEELAESDIPTGDLEPVFPVQEEAGQIDFKKLADPQAISADPVLRAALDLTLSLGVLREQEKAGSEMNPRGSSVE